MRIVPQDSGPFPVVPGGILVLLMTADLGGAWKLGRRSGRTGGGRLMMRSFGSGVAVRGGFGCFEGVLSGGLEACLFETLS